MATKNPRVVGYITSSTHAQLREFMAARRLTESKAVDAVLSEFFQTAPRANNSDTGSIPSSDEVRDRLAALEKQVLELAAAVGESAA